MGPLRVHTTTNNSQDDLRLPSLHKNLERPILACLCTFRNQGTRMCPLHISCHVGVGSFNTAILGDFCFLSLSVVSHGTPGGSENR